MSGWRPVRADTRFEQYDRLVAAALEEAKIGGDPAKGRIYAALAAAEAVLVTESDGRVELSGSLTVDG